MDYKYNLIFLGLLINCGISLCFSLIVSFLNIFVAIWNNSISMEYAILLQNIIRIIVAGNLLIFFVFYQDSMMKEKLEYNLKINLSVFVCILIMLISIILIGSVSDSLKTPFSITIIAMSMLLTGFSEEIVYRMVAMNCYPNHFWLVILLQGIIFSFVGHGLFNDFSTNLFIRLPLGIIFGFIYRYTQKIWYGSCLHGLYNFCIYAEIF